MGPKNNSIYGDESDSSTLELSPQSSNTEVETTDISPENISYYKEDDTIDSSLKSAWSSDDLSDVSLSSQSETESKRPRAKTDDSDYVGIRTSNIEAKRCDHTVILGIKGRKGEKYNNFTESTITRNLYSTGRLHVGPIHKKICSKQTVVDINGDVLVRGDINVKHNLNAESATFNTIVASNGSIQNITANNVIESDIYVEGVSSELNEKIISRGDGINLVYTYPKNGEIIILLGSDDNAIFETNRKLVIKDVTPEFSTGSSFNVKIKVPRGIRIENYGQYGQGGSHGLTVTENGEYLLNSSGGCVSLRFSPSFIIGQLPTWVIESQLIGNPRILPATGLTFDHLSITDRSKLIRK